MVLTNDGDKVFNIRLGVGTQVFQNSLLYTNIGLLTYFLSILQFYESHCIRIRNFSIGRVISSPKKSYVLLPSK